MFRGTPTLRDVGGKMERGMETASGANSFGKCHILEHLLENHNAN